VCLPPGPGRDCPPATYRSVVQVPTGHEVIVSARRRPAAGQALVSFLVSFIHVLRGSARNGSNGQPRSRTLLTYAEPGRADLESVLEPKRTPSRAPKRQQVIDKRA
jgi:hypothetical protein